MSSPFKPNPLHPEQYSFVPDHSPLLHYYETMNAGRRPVPARSSSNSGAVVAGIVFVLLWLAWIGFIVLKANGTL